MMDEKQVSQDVVDDSLYSRQLYVYGHEAQQKLQRTSILLAGMKGLGAEIAKNIILAGVKSVHLLDDGLVEVGDLGSHFYLTAEDVGQKGRAAACHAKLAELNQYVSVNLATGSILDALNSANFDVVVVTEESVSTQIKINNLCRAKGIKCIFGDVHGLFTSMFVDLGASHTVTDTDGEQPKRGLIANVDQKNPGVVLCGDDKRHGLSDGDYVTFEEVEGMVELNDSPARPIKVISPISFSIEDTTGYSAYTGTKGYFNQVKQPKTVSFQSLEATIHSPKIEADYGMSSQLHVLTRAISAFRDKHGGAYPGAASRADASEVVGLLRNIAENQMDNKVDFDYELMGRLARVSGAKIAPMTAFLGGVMGQEVIKACSSKFMPLQQYFYMDASHCLPREDGDLSQYAPVNSRYDHQIAVFGAPLQGLVERSRVFLIGAGAIGCEMLKNFALMGIATDAKGHVEVTDMDTIEKSNLSRQFLFRQSDVGSLKAEVARNAVLKMNADIKIDAKSIRVGGDTEDVYNDEFWQSLSFVITALDNVDARLYTDQRCVYFQKPLIDSGTLGTKGNTQVVLPFKTESYGSSRDPPEEGIPICTLKNFPSKIEHTIQWARDAFEGYFTQNPVETNKYLDTKTYLEDLKANPQVELENVKTVKAYLVDDKPNTFEDCIRWARLLFQKEFHDNILQLLAVFPADSKTPEGAPFWSGHKRAPDPVVFDTADPLHMGYVVAAANMMASMYGMQGSTDEKIFARVISETAVAPFVPKQGVKIAANDEEAKSLAAQMDDDHDGMVASVSAALPAPASITARLIPAEFDKDDDSNFHIDFITHCSNLRARNYRIAEQSRHQTKFIAGKIIPAIATTTAMVTGLVCLELYKILQDKPVEAFRNSFANLAIPLFAFSEPMAPETKLATLKDRGEWNWSLWDLVEIDIGDCTLQELLDHWENVLGLECSMISMGSALVYCNFMPKFASRVNTKVSDLARNFASMTFDDSDKYIIMECCVNDEDYNDIEIPSVRFKFRT